MKPASAKDIKRNVEGLRYAIPKMLKAGKGMYVFQQMDEQKKREWEQSFQFDKANFAFFSLATADRAKALISKCKSRGIETGILNLLVRAMEHEPVAMPDDVEVEQIEAVLRDIDKAADALALTDPKPIKTAPESSGKVCRRGARQAKKGT